MERGNEESLLLSTLLFINKIAFHEMNRFKKSYALIERFVEEVPTLPKAKAAVLLRIVVLHPAEWERESVPLFRCPSISFEELNRQLV